MKWLQVIELTVPAVVGGVVTWFVRAYLEELRDRKKQLQEDQRNIYIEILDPYIQLFANVKGEGTAKAIKKITSYDYRKKAFNFNLIASDKVILAYNNLMKYAYKAEASGMQNPDDPKILEFFGDFLLEIRRSLGNRKTKLKRNDMLRAMIKDIDNYLQA